MNKRFKDSEGFIKENLEIIMKKGYITVEELDFITAIKSLIDPGLNCIVHNECNRYMSVVEISVFINDTTQNVNSIINSLQRKGIIYEFISTCSINNYVESKDTKRSMFINTEIFCNGDTNKLDPTLVMLIKHNDIIERNNIKLPYKIYRDSGTLYGKLQSRLTFKWL